MNAIARKMIMDGNLFVLKDTFFAKLCLKNDTKIQSTKDFIFAQLIRIFSQLRIANNILNAMIPFIDVPFLPNWHLNVLKRFLSTKRNTKK